MKEKIFINVDDNTDKEYSLTVYVLIFLREKGLINTFELNDALNDLRKKYSLPVIDIYGKEN